MKTKQVIIGCVAGLLALAVAAGAAGGAAAKKLDARGADTLKRADAQCEEIAKSIAEITKTKESLEQSADPSTIPEATIRDFKDQIKFARNRLDGVERSIRFLPAEQPEVKAQNERIAAQRASLAAASDAIDAFNKRLESSLKAVEGPQAKAEIERIKTMSKAYMPFTLSEDPKRAADLAARVEEDAKTLASLQQAFKPHVQRGTPEGKEFKYWAEAAENNVGRFRLQCRVYVEKGPEVIPQAIAKAVTTAEQAAADKKPGFFTGAVPQQFDMARRNVEVYAGVVGADDPKTAKLRETLAAAEKKIESLRAGLRQEILAGTKTPPDAYAGADKSQIKGLVEQAWKAQYPKDELLAVRFVTPEWKRKTGATWSAAWKSWEEYDQSEMQVRVIVRTDNKVATVYWVYVTKDHKANDQIKVEARTKGGGSDEMLLANVEQ